MEAGFVAAKLRKRQLGGKMARLTFQDISFEEQDAQLKLRFLKVFESHIDKAELKKLGNYKITEHEIDAPDLSDRQLNNKFLPILDRAFRNLKSVLTGHKTIYIHQNSGIPLIGTLYFGIVDRGTNILEVKPITGCNIDCIFCSVDEGSSSSRKIVDFVVEDDYIIHEVRRLAGFKRGSDPDTKLDVFINPHGEPLLYANMEGLVKGLRAIPEIRSISIITNATLLTKAMAERLASAGLDQLNISLNAIDPGKARELAGTDAYNVEHVLDMCRYVAPKLKLVIAPVWIKGKNDAEIPKLIGFAKDIGAEIGIQNYLVHKKGRKVAKQVAWEGFYDQLELWEKEAGTDLKAKDHTLRKTEPLERPFRKGDMIRAEIVCPGRLKNEALAVAKDRTISVVDPKKRRGAARLKILRDKDNVFVAEEL